MAPAAPAWRRRSGTSASCAADGFGGILAVGRARPPRRGWSGSTTSPPARPAATPRVVLVGKGITFDTGGLSIKPRRGMVDMKTDMAGAAVVLAVLSPPAATLGVPVRVTGLLALAENAVGGVVVPPRRRRHATTAGRTVEITNTDAEGRMVLADALAYADAELDPDVARRRRHAHRRGHARASAAALRAVFTDGRPAGRRARRRRRDDW